MKLALSNRSYKAMSVIDELHVTNKKIIIKQMKNILKIAVLAFMTIYFISCEDLKFGDTFLEKGQSEELNLDSVFSKKIYAEQALSQVYKSLPFGLPTGEGEPASKIGIDILESLTDLQYSMLTYGGAMTGYYNGSLTSSTNTKNVTYSFVKGGGWDGIRDAYIFINNIDRVPDMTAEEKAIRKAEAKMIVAIHYAEMFRYFGGLPLVDKVYSPEDQPQLPRMTAEATLNHIVTLLDEVAVVLPWKIENPVVDDGRMTAAAAMGLKVRVLLFAASPLFNDDKPYMAGKASNEKLVWFGGKNASRWNDVKVACEDFLTRLNNESGYSMVNTGSPRDDFRKAYYDRNNGEVLISTRKGYKGYTGTFMTNSGTCSPTLDYVNMFPMKDGSDFDWNNATNAQYPFFDASGNAVRDPRLYESILINGDVYQGRKAELYIGGTERTSDNRDAGSAATGFIIRKFRLDVNSASGTVLHWPYLRLPEIYLSYAEALNEINGGPTTKAYEMINKTRDRVAVGGVGTGLNQTQFREAILRERALEFGFEEVRYFDINRWKRQDIMQKKNYGLTIKSPNKGITLTFERYEIPITRDWQTRWSEKWYLTPFPIDEVNKGYGISQNPGW